MHWTEVCRQIYRNFPPPPECDGGLLPQIGSNEYVAINTNSVALSPRANYTDRAAATCRPIIVTTFVDRGVSRGQRGGTPTVVNFSFLDRSRYFSFK
jgi:hypothetical protein